MKDVTVEEIAQRKFSWIVNTANAFAFGWFKLVTCSTKFQTEQKGIANLL